MKKGQRYCVGMGRDFVVIEKGLNSKKINKMVNRRYVDMKFDEIIEKGISFFKRRGH